MKLDYHEIFNFDSLNISFNAPEYILFQHYDHVALKNCFKKLSSTSSNFFLLSCAWKPFSRISSIIEFDIILKSKLEIMLSNKLKYRLPLQSTKMYNFVFVKLDPNAYYLSIFCDLKWGKMISDILIAYIKYRDLSTYNSVLGGAYSSIGKCSRIHVINLLIIGEKGFEFSKKTN